MRVFNLKSRRVSIARRRKRCLSRLNVYIDDFGCVRRVNILSRLSVNSQEDEIVVIIVKEFYAFILI